MEKSLNSLANSSVLLVSRYLRVFPCIATLFCVMMSVKELALTVARLSFLFRWCFPQSLQAAAWIIQGC
jgi:hypothetical protein